MLLSDRDIASTHDRGDLEIEPFEQKLIQPSSLDVRLGAGLRMMRGGLIDTRDIKDRTEEIDFDKSHPFVIHPGEFVLAQTLERIKLPDYLAAKLEGKSSLARLGLILHATAGFIDPGFDGTITLELSVSSPNALCLYYGQKIGQLCFFTMSSPAQFPYGHEKLGSHYQHQKGATPSRYEG